MTDMNPPSSRDIARANAQQAKEAKAKRDRRTGFLMVFGLIILVLALFIGATLGVAQGLAAFTSGGADVWQWTGFILGALVFFVAFLPVLFLVLVSRKV
jgi:fructose-specific phosphotransferase system IIC component